MRMALLLSLLTLGCYKSKPVTFDFGYGHLELNKDFRYDARRTERDPDSVRFTFTRVNDTHMNGQTSYAETVVLSQIHPNLPESEFRAYLNRGRYDALYTKQPWSIEMDGPLELQVSSTTYERHPVTEPAIVLRLIDKQNHRVLSWYGYAKRYKLADARQHVKAIYASLSVDPVLYTRFADYTAWQGNGWMDAWFANKDSLIAALRAFHLDLPFQQYIGDTSSWQSGGKLFAAIDGERPSYLHVVQLADSGACSTLDDIAPPLRESFRQLFPKQVLPPCFRVHKLNLWQKMADSPNAIEAWMRESLR